MRRAEISIASTSSVRVRDCDECKEKASKRYPVLSGILRLVDSIASVSHRIERATRDTSMQNRSNLLLVTLARWGNVRALARVAANTSSSESGMQY